MAESKKHFYVVIKGRTPGIYTRWSGTGGAEEQVKGFAGAVFRGFVTREEAEYYQRSGGKGTAASGAPSAARAPSGGQKVSAPALPSSSAGAGSSGESTRQVELPPAGRPRKQAAHQADLAAGKVVVFTDGASTGNPGPGGYGVVILTGDQRKELAGGFRCTTNNRMEMMGVISALQVLPPGSQVVLYSDSRYLINAVQLGWAKRWRSRGWMRDAENPAENADLWAKLLDLLDLYPVEFRWVKGHANNPENERCDRLAVQAAHQRDLPVDPGYRGRC